MHAFYLYRTSENYLEQLQKPIIMSVYYRQNIIYTPKKEIPKQAVLTRLFYLLTENEKLRIVLRKKVNISGKASDLMHDMPFLLKLFNIFISIHLIKYFNFIVTFFLERFHFVVPFFLELFNIVISVNIIKCFNFVVTFLLQLFNIVISVDIIKCFNFVVTFLLQLFNIVISVDIIKCFNFVVTFFLKRFYLVVSVNII